MAANCSPRAQEPGVASGRRGDTRVRRTARPGRRRAAALCAVTVLLLAAARPRGGPAPGAPTQQTESRHEGREISFPSDALLQDRRHAQLRSPRA